MSTGPTSSIEAVSVTGEVNTTSLEDLTAKVKTIQKEMESVGTDIAKAETTKAAAEDISNKIDSLDMNTFIIGSRLRRQEASTTYPTPTNCNELKSRMDELKNALDSNALDYDPVRADSIVTMLTSLDASNLSPGCSWEEFEDLISAWSAAKENAEALVMTLTDLIDAKKNELYALKGKLNALWAEMTGHCQGTSSNEQCYGMPNGTPCTKNCTAPDCRPPQSKCCHGCCKRGNELAILGC